jgi:hypothetical protein
MRRREFTSSQGKSAMDTDYVIFFAAAPLVVIGAGLFRVQTEVN